MKKRSPIDAKEVEEEFEAHIRHRADDLVREGMAEDAALAQARGEFGDAVRLRDETIDAGRRGPWPQAGGPLEGLVTDVRFAFRQLRRAPGFATAALLTLTLGLGATATVVTVVNAVSLAPLPFGEPDRIYTVGMLTPEGASFSVAAATFVDWSDQSTSFESMAAFEILGGTLRTPGTSRAVQVGRISHESLDVLGLRPALGRMFRAEEDRPGSPADVVLLSHGSWVAEFGADPRVVGTVLDLDGRRLEILGVMPAAMDLLMGDVPLFVPLGPDPSLDREDHYLTVLGRLGPRVDGATAAQEMRALQTRISEIHGEELGWSVELRPIDDVLIGDATRTAGWILLAAAAFLLVMACVNVSNLLTVRATSRGTEMGLRAALGADRFRLVRQLATESAVLVTLGTAAGLVVAWLALPVIRNLGEGRVIRLDEASVDGGTLLLSAVAALLCCVVCGLTPLLQMGRVGLGSMGGSRSVTDRGSRLRTILVGAQVAITVVLMAGTGLLLRSFLALSSVDPGFDVAQTMAVRVSLPDESYSVEDRANLVPRLRRAVAGVPGVEAVGATATDPLSGGSLAGFVAAEARMPDRAADFTPMAWRAVTGGFFESMSIPVLSGRTFGSEDLDEAARNVIVSAQLAETLWPGEDPLDRVAVWGDPQGGRYRVIGVVGDVRDVALGEDPRLTLYLPYTRAPWPSITLLVRVGGAPSEVVPRVRETIARVAPGLPAADFHPLADHVSRAVAEPRFNVQLVSVFGGAGLLMALVGVYGLTAFEVRRRVREIGIRISLGAPPGGILRMMLRQRLISTLLGVASGVVVAWWLTRWIESLLYGITPNDPVTWLVVVGGILGAAMLAAYVPAARATRVDPREALRAES